MNSICIGIFRGIVRKLLVIIPLIKIPRINVYLYRLLGYNLDSSVRIYSSANIMGSITVNIGEGTYIGHQSTITGGMGCICIGKNCDISDRVSIFCGTHEISNTLRSAGKGIGKDIIIGDGVWIGYGALILPGVKIGDMAIIAAGSVVHKDVASFNVVGGNPMKTIRTRSNSIK